MNSNHSLPAAGNDYFAANHTNRSRFPTGFLPARYLRERYRVSDMTIWRWLRDEEMNFPKPVYFGRFRYWRIADIEAWEEVQAERGGRHDGAV